MTLYGPVIIISTDSSLAIVAVNIILYYFLVILYIILYVMVISYIMLCYGY